MNFTVTRGNFCAIYRRVTKKTEGLVEFEYYPAEQLGKLADLYELTADGVSDIGAFVPSYIPSKMPITSGFLGILQECIQQQLKGSLAYDEITKKIQFKN